jgi:hypothetical protein
MQVEAKKGEGYANLRDCYRRVTTTEGYRALWKGVVPRVLRSSPQYGVMLFSYELLQRLFNNDVQSSISMDVLEDKKWVKMLLLEDKMGILLENSWGKYHSLTTGLQAPPAPSATTLIILPAQSLAEPPTSFTRFKGGFKHISVGGSTSVWAISRGDEIYRWKENQWYEPPATLLLLLLVSGPHPALVTLVREKTTGAKLKQLSAAEDGAVWGVNNNGEVFFADMLRLKRKQFADIDSLGR